MGHPGSDNLALQRWELMAALIFVVRGGSRGFLGRLSQQGLLPTASSPTNMTSPSSSPLPNHGRNDRMPLSTPSSSLLRRTVGGVWEIRELGRGRTRARTADARAPWALGHGNLKNASLPLIHGEARPWPLFHALPALLRPTLQSLTGTHSPLTSAQ